MIDFLINLFSVKNKCSHKNALLNSEEGYCPDCGKYLKKYYYIIRCKHCDIKRRGEVLYQGIYPVDSFCENCGGDDFYVEKLEKINFFDIKYAIISKEVVEDEKQAQEVFQIWTECDFREKIAGYLMQKAYAK
ncbi:hypothetical protein IKA15_01310 [bacterium]|nr:hypothetical protein [bacterium]